MRREQFDLQQPPGIVHLAVEMPQPLDQLRGVGELAVVAAQIGEEEEDAARRAISLRLVDEEQRVQSSSARIGPQALREEGEENVERGVDPLRGRAGVSKRTG